jgi:hypothetical protein
VELTYGFAFWIYNDLAYLRLKMIFVTSYSYSNPNKVICSDMKEYNGVVSDISE